MVVPLDAVDQEPRRHAASPRVLVRCGDASHAFELSPVEHGRGEKGDSGLGRGNLHHFARQANEGGSFSLGVLVHVNYQRCEASDTAEEQEQCQRGQS